MNITIHLQSLTYSIENLLVEILFLRQCKSCVVCSFLTALKKYCQTKFDFTKKKIKSTK